MNLKERKSVFVALGKRLETFLAGYEEESYLQNAGDAERELALAMKQSIHFNAWFTEDNIRKALGGIVYMLDPDRLNDWLKIYAIPDEGPSKKVAIVMAGNIPLVGFHDFLSVILSGNIAICKLSSSDNRIWPCIFSLLLEIDPNFGQNFELVDRLKEMDAVIATGSNNTGRYFDYYFSKYPSIIRRNRNSIALLTGKESDEELDALAEDVFTFFGLGCRNVSKIYMPEGMDLNRVIKAFYSHKDVINHHKYANNYDYNKSVMLLNQDDVIENGFMLFKVSKD